MFYFGDKMKTPYLINYNIECENKNSDIDGSIMTGFQRSETTDPDNFIIDWA